MTTVALFDIDGTLLWTDGAGRRAIHAALDAVFGGRGPNDFWFDGKTDRQIVRELMRREGHADALIDERMTLVLDRYLAGLERELRRVDRSRAVLPGVCELLDALEGREDVVLGLLTGNIALGAAAKLRAVGIDPARFRIGAFGSDEEHRPALATVALRRARETLGVELAARDLVVIGDTPADVDCGRRAGSRTIGVATGRYSADELAAHGADAVFPDLSDTGALVRAIAGE